MPAHAGYPVRRGLSTSLRAQRSNPSRRAWRYGLLRFARNDGWAEFGLLAALIARGLQLRLSLQNLKGAGKTGCTLHPRSRVQFAQTKRTRAYRFSGNTPAFPAQWLYGLLRALPGERLFCLRRHANKFTQLSASTAAPEPHDFTVRIRRVRLARRRVHRISPHVRDDRGAPLIRGRPAKLCD